MSEASITVPVTIFTGFLGSGKTTIISHLVDELQTQKQQVIYVKNEIGDEAVDTQIIKGKNIKTKELLNGCICCTLVGPFMSAIDEVLNTFHPDRIIIEASGAADPSAIALMVSSHPRLHRDGVISIVDVVNFEGYSDLSQTARNQTKFTDIIVFNKVELASLDRKQTVVEHVRELNAHSPILEAPHGQLPIAVAFGISTSQLDQLLNGTTVHDHEHNHEQDQITTCSLDIPAAFTLDKLKQWLLSLPTTIFRVKGFFSSSTEGNWLINKVGQRLEITPLPESESDPADSKIVCIGFQVATMKDELRQQMQAHIS